jgi:hypothetical protein
MMARRHRGGFLQRLRGSEAGSVAIEFGLTVWIVLLLMMMALEFGRLFYHDRVVRNGVRDAARYLARVDDPSLASVQQNARNLAMWGMMNPDPAVDEPLIVYWDDPSTVQYALKSVANTAALRGGATLPVIHVRADVPYAPGYSFLGAVGLGRLTLSAAHEERWIGD